MDLGQRNKVSPSAGMSSMTDLVFLLLIFFVILSTLVSSGVNVDLPQSKGGIATNTKVDLTIKADMTYYIQGGEVAKDDVESLLVIKFENINDKVLYLNIDKDVPTGATVEMIGMAKSNNWKVMLGSKPKKE